MNEPAHGWGRKQITSVAIAILRAIGVALGIFLLVISIPLFFLPVPFGLPLAVLGLLIIAAISKTAHTAITNFLKRHPRVWDRVKPIFDRFQRKNR